MGRDGCEAGDGGSRGVAEEVFVVEGGEDLLVPEEGEMIILKGWGLWWGEVGR